MQEFKNNFECGKIESMQMVKQNFAKVRELAEFDEEKSSNKRINKVLLKDFGCDEKFKTQI